MEAYLLSATMRYTEVLGREGAAPMITFILRETCRLLQPVYSSFQPGDYFRPVRFAYRPADQDGNDAILVIDNGQRGALWELSVSA